MKGAWCSAVQRVSSPSANVLIEESIYGWKEYELELMRDGHDNVVLVGEDGRPTCTTGPAPGQRGNGAAATQGAATRSAPPAWGFMVAWPLSSV